MRIHQRCMTAFETQYCYYENVLIYSNVLMINLPSITCDAKGREHAYDKQIRRVTAPRAC